MSAKFRVSAVQTYNSAVTGQAGLMFRDRRFNIAEDKGVIDLSESRQKLDVIDRQIVELACKTLAEKKAVDIKIIEVVGMTDITDYFIVCSGRSMPQVKALCENLEEKMEENGVFARRKEGAETGRWIVIDYLNVVVHIFHHETREFYQLDKLWNNGNNVVDYGE